MGIAVSLADALTQALHGNDQALTGYGEQRRPIAKRIIALADRLTRLATVRPRLRPLRNGVMMLLRYIPLLRKQLALTLAGLNYR